MNEHMKAAFEDWLQRWLESHKSNGVAYQRHQLEAAYQAGIESMAKILQDPIVDTITVEDYQNACMLEDAAQEFINNAYQRRESQKFAARYQKYRMGDQYFEDWELVYAREKRCDCGYGLAYPKDCGAFHHWACAGQLLGRADPGYTHTGRLPFTMYKIKSETDDATTRGTVKPNPKAQRKSAD